MAWNAQFFETRDGECPALDFLNGVHAKMQARLAVLVEAVEQNGFGLGGGYFEACHGYSDLFEIRAKVSRSLGRIYCTLDGGILVLVSGLLKEEGEATPEAALEQAAAYIREYRETKRLRR